MALGHSGSQLNTHGFLFFSKPQDTWVRFPIYRLIGPSATMTVQVWTQPLGGFCWPTWCDLLGEENTIPPPCWQPIGGCLGQKTWRAGRAGLSLSILGMHWPPCQTAVTAPWPVMDTEQQTTRTEACFLFACRHVACPPWLPEDSQMPGGSLEREAFVPWIIPLDSELLIELREWKSWLKAQHSES